MNKVLGFFKSISHFLVLPLISGILVGTSYIPFNGWALLFCYIPLWFKILQILRDNKKISQVFWAAWFTQFILTLIGFNWIYYVSSEFGQLPKILSLGALFLFAGLMHLYIPFSLLIAALLVRKLKIHNQLVVFVIFALFMALTERVWPSIFEWNLGYTLLWMKMPLFQWADTVGFWGLSTWILVSQAVVAYAVSLFKSNRIQSLVVLSQLFVVLGLLTVIGYYKGQNWNHTDDSVKIAVAQGNIGNAEKVQSEKQSQYHSYIIGIYAQLTDELFKKNPADMMIWPETAMPLALDQAFLPAKDQQTILTNVRNWNVPLVTGAYSVDSKAKNYLGETVIRNSVFYLSPQMNYAAAPYYKTNLLAFGEYLPFGEQFPFLYKLLPFVGVLAKGSGPQVAELKVKEKQIKL
ncbi:MAG: apolipoprotein N-acyltransferase, partial [Pseudobdellovibrio sp.]